MSRSFGSLWAGLPIVTSTSVIGPNSLATTSSEGKGVEFPVPSGTSMSLFCVWTPAAAGAAAASAARRVVATSARARPGCLQGAVIRDLADDGTGAPGGWSTLDADGIFAGASRDVGRRDGLGRGGSEQREPELD